MVCHISLSLMSTGDYFHAKCAMKGMWIVLDWFNTWPSLLPTCLKLGLVYGSTTILPAEPCWMASTLCLFGEGTSTSLSSPLSAIALIIISKFNVSRCGALLLIYRQDTVMQYILHLPRHNNVQDVHFTLLKSHRIHALQLP